MLTFNAPNLGCCNANAFDFWHLRISKTFGDKPKYYIGQTVFHVVEVERGEILYPVEVIGIFWTGISWDYAVLFPKNHPWFVSKDRDTEWVNEKQIEPM